MHTTRFLWTVLIYRLLARHGPSAITRYTTANSVCCLWLVYTFCGLCYAPHYHARCLFPVHHRSRTITAAVRYHVFLALYFYLLYRFCIFAHAATGFLTLPLDCGCTALALFIARSRFCVSLHTVLVCHRCARVHLVYRDRRFAHSAVFCAAHHAALTGLFRTRRSSRAVWFVLMSALSALAASLYPAALTYNAPTLVVLCRTR